MPTYALADARRHRSPNCHGSFIRISIASKYPDNIFFVFVSVTEPIAGVIHHRDDLGYVIAHPCHPSVFNWEPSEAAFRDFYGGISAKQSIVVAKMYGNEEQYKLAESIAEEMYAPIKDTHRVTLEQMAILEPALVETLAQTCMEIIKEGYDKILEMGVPRPAVDHPGDWRRRIECQYHSTRLHFRNDLLRNESDGNVRNCQDHNIR